MVDTLDWSVVVIETFSSLRTAGKLMSISGSKHLGKVKSAESIEIQEWSARN